MAAQLLWGNHDLVFYPPQQRAAMLYRNFKFLGKKKPVIFWVEGTAQQFLSAPSKQLLFQLSFMREAAVCYGNSPYVAESMRREFNKHMEVMPLGVDVHHFTPWNRWSQKGTFPVKVLNLATIQERKQTHIMLNLARFLPPDLAEFHIYGYVIGNPSYLDSLLKRKSDENLTHVYFHGKVLHADLPNVLRAHDIFVLPSRLEGVPRITLEAAACGLPCIVFDDYQTSSVLDGITGFQVKTEAQMREKLEVLIRNPELRITMGQKATSYVKKFDWGNIVKQWEMEFEKIASSWRDY